MPKPNKRQMQEEERDVPVLKHKRNGYEENVEQRQTIPEHTSVTPQLPPPHNVWTDGGLFESIDEVTIKMESYSDNDEEMDTKMMEMEEDIVKVEHDIDEDDGDCMSTLHPPCSTMHQVLQSSDQHDVQMMDSDKSKQDNNRHTNQQPRHEMMATSDSATPHQVIPGPATPHQVIPGPATPHQVIPGPATPHQVIPGPATPHQVIPGPVTPHQVIPGPTNTHGFEWSDGYDFEPDIHPFDKSASGVTPVFPIRKLESELKYFEAFFDNQVMAKITEETNQHHAYLLQHINEEEKSPHSHIKDWKDTSIRELYVFLALVILMSHSLRPTLTDYWKKDKLLGTTSFGKYMSRNRFKALMSTLHFSSNASCLRNMVSQHQDTLDVLPYSK
ncbi:hypothetical protein Pcinc_027347 [Petrolisthes cinctipes]|uniref:PiggyBac transposable element-derived protein domain-containing protein n=1 Tax=Petrolisthes cinctipes TaxID=88211 RepID=A0AAE1F487_PETCI|nr:hypothetical protein Pcinc_027347 [Petrolisthes cinctipes]